MIQFKGIIFDIDGTLTSTNKLIFASFNFITEKYLGKTFTNEEILKWFGPTEDVILKEFCGDNYEKAREEYYKFYSDNHNRFMADIYPGMKEILDELKSRGVLLSIYTGKGREAARITLKKLEIYDYFDLIITGDEVKEHKPSPEGIEIFLEKFKLDKNEVLMIGDAPSDIKAAHAAGVKVASVLWDSLAKHHVLKMNTDYVFNTVAELKQFLLFSLRPTP
ncbi:MAG TPA: HAD-IA family hydrolase [Ignavibacteriaceae bacterium]|nr:HAD-IA family hydrolase [Ignavibacteriaceae bacterium]